MAGDFRKPEELLERLFLVRHELVTVRTMAAQSHDVLARIGSLERMVPEPDRAWARDLASSTCCAASPTASASSCAA